MFDHLVAFLRLRFDQELIDDGNGIGLFAQVSDAFLQGLRPVRFLACFGKQALRALRAAG